MVGPARRLLPKRSLAANVTLRAWVRLWRDTSGVTESMGTMLLIVVLFISGTAVAGLITLQTPDDPKHTEIEISVGAGTSGWASGDESITVLHAGGEALRAADTTITVTYLAQSLVYAGDELVSVFSDGWFTVGERWSRTVTLGAGVPVSVELITTDRSASGRGGFDIVGQGGYSSTRLAAKTVTTATLDCAGDVQAPILQSWTQAPSDINEDTLVPAVVGVTYFDDCIGISNVDPVLHSRINDGTDPGFTLVGTMTRVSAGTWQATVPVPTGGWAAAQGSTLEYRLDPSPTDASGNGGAPSAVRQDLIEDLDIPVANITYACTGLGCTFNGSASTDRDGFIATYAWDFGDGTTASGNAPAHTYAAGGTFAVNLTVTDNLGFTDTARENVTVSPPNTSPVAAFTYGCAALTCTFDASGSTDSDGVIVARAWSFGDSTSGTGAVAVHTYTSDGTYTVRLDVTDDDGATGTQTRSVTVAVPKMHVHDIDHTRKSGSKAQVDVWVHAADETAVSGATVVWKTCKSGGACATITATTDAAGRATGNFGPPGGGSGTYTTCVTALTVAGHQWAPSSDHAASSSCETEAV